VVCCVQEEEDMLLVGVEKGEEEDDIDEPDEEEPNDVEELVLESVCTWAFANKTQLNTQTTAINDMVFIFDDVVSTNQIGAI